MWPFFFPSHCVSLHIEISPYEITMVTRCAVWDGCGYLSWQRKKQEKKEGAKTSWNWMAMPWKVSCNSLGTAAQAGRKSAIVYSVNIRKQLGRQKAAHTLISCNDIETPENFTQASSQNNSLLDCFSLSLKFLPITMAPIMSCDLPFKNLYVNIKGRKISEVKFLTVKQLHRLSLWWFIRIRQGNKDFPFLFHSYSSKNWRI